MAWGTRPRARSSSSRSHATAEVTVLCEGDEITTFLNADWAQLAGVTDAHTGPLTSTGLHGGDLKPGVVASHYDRLNDAKHAMELIRGHPYIDDAGFRQRPNLPSVVSGVTPPLRAM